MFELETQEHTSLDSSCGEEVDGESEHEVDNHLGQPAERPVAVGEGEDRARGPWRRLRNVQVCPGARLRSADRR